jgi:hypothetical protein
VLKFERDAPWLTGGHAAQVVMVTEVEVVVTVEVKREVVAAIVSE